MHCQNYQNVQNFFDYLNFDREKCRKTNYKLIYWVYFLVFILLCWCEFNTRMFAEPRTCPRPTSLRPASPEFKQRLPIKKKRIFINTPNWRGKKTYTKLWKKNWKLNGKKLEMKVVFKIFSLDPYEDWRTYPYTFKTKVTVVISILSFPITCKISGPRFRSENLYAISKST